MGENRENGGILGPNIFERKEYGGFVAKFRNNRPFNHSYFVDLILVK